MVLSSEAPVAPTPIPVRSATIAPKGSVLARMVRTTDHKLIGQMYLVTSFVFFFVGGLMALLMRAELARPGMQFLSPEQYNQLFTMHGTIMLLLFATPLVFAFANLVLLTLTAMSGRDPQEGGHLISMGVPVDVKPPDGAPPKPEQPTETD